MTIYARVEKGVVAELWQAPANIPPPKAFHADIAAQFVECDDTVKQGWTYDGAHFAAPVAPTPTKDDLIVYANAKQWSLAAGSYTVTIAGEPRTFATDAVSMTLIAGKALRLEQTEPPATVDWQFANGFSAIAATDFTAAAVAIADFVQATFDALKTVLADIAAGTITTTAQVDSAAWPMNHN